MRSKTSFFNKALFLSDIKRYWWICAVETLLLVLTCAVPVYINCLEAYYLGRFDIFSWIHTALYVTVPFGFGTAVLLFSFMHFNASVSAIHSLPTKRSAIFTTKLISGLLLGTVPVVITSIILGIMSAGETCKNYIDIADILKWTYAAIMYGILVFSLTTVVNMMTGNPVGTVIFTIGFAVIIPIFIALFTSIFEEEIHGFNSRYAGSSLEYIYIAPSNMLKVKYAFIYPVLSVVFLFGAHALYRVRKSEKHGEVIAFQYLVPVFMGIIATLASGIGHSYSTGVLGINSLFTIIPFGTLGTLVAYMIWKKSISLKGFIKPLGIYLSLALVFIGVIEFDLTGFERYVPMPDDVKSVSVSDNKSNGEAVFDNADDIALVTELHTFLTIEKERYVLYGSPVEIKYKLKNGRTIKREYLVDYDADKSMLKPLYETNEFRKAQFDILSHKADDFVSAQIDDRRFEQGKPVTLYPDNDMFEKLAKAVKKDIENTKYEDLTSDRNSSMSVSLSWNESVPNSKQSYQRSEIFYVKDTSINTKKVLEEMGIYDKIPGSDDISSINVTIHTSKDDTSPTTYKITDAEKIATVYAMYDDMISESQTYADYLKAVDVYLEYTLKNGHSFGVSRTYDEDKIPQIFR